MTLLILERKFRETPISRSTISRSMAPLPRALMPKSKLKPMARPLTKSVKPNIMDRTALSVEVPPVNMKLANPNQDHRVDPDLLRATNSNNKREKDLSFCPTIKRAITRSHLNTTKQSNTNGFKIKLLSTRSLQNTSSPKT